MEQQAGVMAPTAAPAVANGHVAVVNHLVQQGRANVQARTDHDQTCLHVAPMYGHVGFIHFFHERGVDPTLSDNNDENPC